MISLPTLLRRPRYALAYALPWVPYICVYQLVNRFPILAPQQLPFTFLDRAVPFYPELLPLYVAYIPFYWWTGYRSESDEVFNRFLYATHLQLFVCVAIWIAFPVTMPRDAFYVAASYNWADTFWRWFDAPNNCFPSLHAANCLLFAEFNWHRPYRCLHLVLSAAIIASTVLVKQHYVVDLAAGVAVYAVASAFLKQLTLTKVGGWPRRKCCLEEVNG